MNPVWQQVLAGLGAILGILFIAAVGYGVSAFEKWTGIQLTQQERDIIEQAAESIAGALKVLIAQGALKAEHLKDTDPQVTAVVAAHLRPRVSLALQHQDENISDLVRQAIAKVGQDHAALMVLSQPPS